jgi:hypothetical protein
LTPSSTFNNLTNKRSFEPTKKSSSDPKYKPIPESVKLEQPTPEPVELLNNNSPGFYNDSLDDIYPGNTTNLLSTFFPGPNVSTGDPTQNFSKPPNLSSINELGDWLSNPKKAVRNGYWRKLQTIPQNWAANTETAIIYEIDGGDSGFSNVKGKFGVDNGILIWVNGKYKFGAIAVGEAYPQEYSVDLGDLKPGKNYIQILREDHGVRTGYYISVTGTHSNSSSYSRKIPDISSAVLAVPVKACSNENRLNVRDYPSLQSNVIDKINHNNCASVKTKSFSVTGNSLEWVKVALPDGRNGYVANKYLTFRE